MEQYIHPNNEEITQFIEELELRNLSLKDTTLKIFEWLDNNIAYSRLNSPYFPLQRSDLDLLEFRSGTCGDYSNFLASVLITLDFKVKYVLLKTDCYKNPQEHICLTVQENNVWKLIDPTNPYRKFCGFDCQHQEYEIKTPEEFLKWNKELERKYLKQADEFGDHRYAGLLFAPWIHQDTIFESEELLEVVFYLLILEKPKSFQIYSTYIEYTKNGGYTPIMCRIENGIENYSFSIHTPKNLWDSNQWSEEYLVDEVPQIYKDEKYFLLKDNIQKRLKKIENIANLKS